MKQANTGAGRAGPWCGVRPHTSMTVTPERREFTLTCSCFIRVSDEGFALLLCEDSGPGALVQWVKLPAWKVGDRGFKETLTCKD